MKISDYIFTKEQLELLIPNFDKYLAHLSITESKPEKLIEHLLLVQDYFIKFVEKHELESVIKNLIYSLTDDVIIRKIVFELFIKSIVIHDFGKVNPDFQKLKMSNDIGSLKHDLSSSHSLISGYVFSVFSEVFVSKLNVSEEDEVFIDYLILCFSYPILKHHSSTLNSFENDLNYSEHISDLNKFNSVFKIKNEVGIIEELNEYVFQNTNNIILDSRSKLKEQFPLFALLKLNYSLLTASDYYATTHFMNGWNKMESDFGIFDDKLKNKIVKNIETKEMYNKKTYDELEGYELKFPTEISGDNLNVLRQNLSVETIRGIRGNINRNLFYIEAPTGGGKTNLSMLALAEFLRNDIENSTNNITKVFYVFPFTTLITQTFKSLKDTLGLENDEIVQIHSKAGFSQKGSDDKYGKGKDNIIDYQFVNYPIALLSHIKFFDILKSNRKSANYLLHRLANSVVIIDELQTYSPKQWDKVIYFINEYSRHFNIKFILMSATLPKIDKLLSDKGKKENFSKDEFVYLNKNKDRYFTNENFKNRVEFDFSMLNNSDFDKKDKDVFIQNLWDKVLSESIDYKTKSKLKRVHTIIEFIFKKTASEFVELVNKEDDFYDEIFILSGTTLEPRRREIISKLKSPEYVTKNILLITTQVVEAGVDIDMDLGFKDSSLIDSDEQLAGRINRNVNKPQCKLFIFDYDDAKVIYGNDSRFKKLQGELKDDYKKILDSKDFDIVYDAVIKDRDNHNEQKAYDDNLPSYLKSMKALDFKDVNDKFKLIDDSISNTSIYVPLEIPICIPNSKMDEEDNFLEEELSFLKKKEKYNGESFVCGEKIWELYCEIIKNKSDDFVKDKKEKIIMQGLISKFSFSVATYSKANLSLQSSGYGEEIYGFYKINDVEKVYDYNDGIKTLEFEDVNFM